MHINIYTVQTSWLKLEVEVARPYAWDAELNLLPLQHVKQKLLRVRDCSTLVPCKGTVLTKVLLACQIVCCN